MTQGIFWIASYPKSGNTWMRLAINSLRAGGADIDINANESDNLSTARHLFDRLLDIDSGLLTPDEILAARPAAFRLLAASQTATVFLKTHEACIATPGGVPLFPAEATAGAVYLVRDPRDVAISLAHHGGYGIEAAIERMARDDWTLSPVGRRLDAQLPHLIGGWSRNVASWLDAGPCAPLLLRYEDMLADPARALRLTAQAAGLPADAVDGAVRATGFARLQRQERENGFFQRPPQAAQFFRAGRAGHWRDGLTADQARRIERRHGAVMARLGYL